MSYSNIYRIDPSKTNYAIHFSNDFTAFGIYSRTGVGPIPPLYIPELQSSQKLIPGVIAEEQSLGAGQPKALRLYDAAARVLRDLSVTELRNEIIMEIDSNNNIKIRCVENSSYLGQYIWTMIFNIYDASGWALNAETDISLNFTNNFGVNQDTQFDISLAGIDYPISVISSIDASHNIQDISKNEIGNSESSDISYSIYIKNNNELYIKCSHDASFNNWYINSLDLFLHNISNTILSPSNLYLHLLPSTSYIIDPSDPSFNVDASFNIKMNTQIPNIRNQDLIKLDPSGSQIGILQPNGYRIYPNISFYNINNLTWNFHHLIKLDISGVILGKLQIN